MNPSKRDGYIEQVVKRKNSIGMIFLRIFMIMTALFLSFLVFVFYLPFFFYAIFVLGLVLIFIFNRLKIEYDYILISDTLEISVIRNQKNRTKLLSINLNSVGKFEKYSKLPDNVEKVYRFVSSSNSQTIYSLSFTNPKNKNSILLFEPCPRLIEAIKYFA